MFLRKPEGGELILLTFRARLMIQILCIFVGGRPGIQAVNGISGQLTMLSLLAKSFENTRMPTETDLSMVLINTICLIVERQLL